MLKRKKGLLGLPIEGNCNVTTLLDLTESPKQDLEELLRARWNQQLDLRSIKATMQMDFMRCKTPELARKEAWTPLLAYNLIRTVMAQAGDKHDIEPRTLSFKGTVQTLEAFQPFIVSVGRSQQLRAELYQQLLEHVVIHRVASFALVAKRWHLEPSGKSLCKSFTNRSRQCGVLPDGHRLPRRYLWARYVWSTPQSRQSR